MNKEAVMRAGFKGVIAGSMLVAVGTAYSDKEELKGKYVNCSRENFLNSLDSDLTHAKMFAPYFAKPSRVALPIPLLQPVIITFLLFNDFKYIY